MWWNSVQSRFRVLVRMLWGIRLIHSRKVPSNAWRLLCGKRQNKGGLYWPITPRHRLFRLLSTWRAESFRVKQTASIRFKREGESRCWLRLVSPLLRWALWTTSAYPLLTRLLISLIEEFNGVSHRRQETRSDIKLRSNDKWCNYQFYGRTFNTKWT